MFLVKFVNILLNQERMGGSDDGSGTGQAANVATDHDPEDGSAAEGIETASAEALAETATMWSKASAQEMTAISEDKLASGEGSVDGEDTDGVRAAGSARKKGGALSSPDQTASDPAADAEVATPKFSAASMALLPAAAVVGDGDDVNALAPATEAGNEAGSPLASVPLARDGSKTSGTMLPVDVLRQPETAAAELRPGNQKDAPPGGSSEREEKQSTSDRGRQTPERAGKKSKAGEESSGGASDATTKAATHKKKEGGMEELLESTVSHTVDCLVYIRWCVRRGCETEA